MLSTITTIKKTCRDETPVIEWWESAPKDYESALTVHVWTPAGTAKNTIIPHPVVDRYIVAVDQKGIISTGHTALESPEGIYISLYPAQDIDHSPDQFSRLLRATTDNNVEGVFKSDYVSESQKWCPSTIKVRIRNYDAKQLQLFWDVYKQDNTYNLTHRNCSSSVFRGLEAALEGAVSRIWGKKHFLWILCRLLITPELWIASQIRKRAGTMAWTPGLLLDYARAMSMLADPRPAGWMATIKRCHIKLLISLKKRRNTFH